VKKFVKAVPNNNLNKGVIIMEVFYYKDSDELLLHFNSDVRRAKKQKMYSDFTLLIDKENMFVGLKISNASKRVSRKSFRRLSKVEGLKPEEIAKRKGWVDKKTRKEKPKRKPFKVKSVFSYAGVEPPEKKRLLDQITPIAEPKQKK